MQEKFRPGVFCRRKLSCVFAAMVFCLALVCVSAEDGNWCLGKDGGFPEPVVPEGSFGPDGSLALRVRILEERVAELASCAGENVPERLCGGFLPGVAGAVPVFASVFPGFVPGSFCPDEGVVFPPWAVSCPPGFQGPGFVSGQGGFPVSCPGTFLGMPGKFRVD